MQVSEDDPPRIEPAESGPGVRRPLGPFPLLALALAIALALLAGSVVLVIRRGDKQRFPTQQLRPAGIPASISTSLADLMGLSPVGQKTAPGFRLVDQNGHTVSLSSFRGQAVVLEFMDPHCTDICPLISQEFERAYSELGSAAAKVVFLAVNVNQYHGSVNDVLTFSREQNLVEIPNWHFVTGQVANLKTVWQDYGIKVRAPNPNADIIHTSIVYFIDPHSVERFVASPTVDHTPAGDSYLPLDQLAAWGHGMALIANQLVS